MKLTPLWDPSLLIQNHSRHGFDNYYDDIPEEDIELEYGEKKYYGRTGRVIWIGEKGAVFRATPNITSPWKYNVFSPDKLTAIKQRIEDGETPVIFTSLPYAEVYPVSITEIQEMQESFKSGHFQEDYAIDRPFSTGDNELDQYLADPNEYLEENYLEEEREEAKADFEQRKHDAIANQSGDLDSYWVQIRDGNHRVFGAFAAGEPYVYVKVLTEDLVFVDPIDLE